MFNLLRFVLLFCSGVLMISCKQKSIVILKKEVAYELILAKETRFGFSLLEPGTYSLRVIEDRNENGIWDPSNYQMRKSAERIFYYEGEDRTRDLVIRGGWTVEDLIIRATKATGLKKTTRN